MNLHEVRKFRIWEHFRLGILALVAPAVSRKMTEVGGTFLLIQSSHPEACWEGMFGLLLAWVRQLSLTSGSALNGTVFSSPSYLFTHPGGIMVHGSRRSFSAALRLWDDRGRHCSGCTNET